MARITLAGNPATTLGELPMLGTIAPNFSVVNKEMATKFLADYQGSRLILNIFPSIDTGVCAAAVRRFNEEVSKLRNTKVLCISKDLPFALHRFCGAGGIQNVEVLSDFRGDFSSKYPLALLDTHMKGLLSRCIIVLDETGRVIYTEQVPEIKTEPNYQAIFAILG